jgi:hypothetical protein
LKPWDFEVFAEKIYDFSLVFHLTINAWDLLLPICGGHKLEQTINALFQLKYAYTQPIDANFSRGVSG